MFFERQKNIRTCFFERQNSSGGLRPPQQSIVQPLLLVMMICCISLIRIIRIHLLLNTDYSDFTEILSQSEASV